MKVGIVLNSAWNIVNFRMGLIGFLQDLGHEVVAIAGADGYEEKLRQAGLEFIPVNIQATGSNPVRDLKLLSQLVQVYRTAGLEVVLQFTIKPNTYGTLAARRVGIPAVNNVSGLGTIFLKKNLTSFIGLNLYRLTFPSANMVFFQNEDDRQLFLKKGLVRQEKTDLLPGSGIDPETFKPATIERRAGPFTFLLVSRLIYEKGIMEYIQAIRSLRDQGLDARFQLLGQLDETHVRGISGSDLQEWVDQGLLEYLGVLEDVRPAIAGADALVLPSYREGTPRTLLEGAAMGKPLIATDVPGCREVVRDGINGMLCRVRDGDDLATKMKKMMRLSPDRLAKMGHESRELILSTFDQRFVFEKYRKILIDIEHGI